MSEPEEPAGPPDLEELRSGRSDDIGAWRWLWTGDHRFPPRSHRPVLGRLIVLVKRLLHPLVRAPQNDLWERQRVFNLTLLRHFDELYKLQRGLDELGQDLQRVQADLLRDLREVRDDLRADHERDIGDLSTRLEHIEEFLRDGLKEVMDHHDALFARLDQKIDRLRRDGAAD